jgi:D-3-phosphoglycerate dehydrogenase
MTDTIKLGLVATDNALLPELLTEMLPSGWNLLLAGTDFDDAQKQMLGEVDYLLMAGGWMPREAIDAAPKLRMIQKLGVGYDGIDLERLAERKIILANCPVDSAALAVAEHSVALAVSALKRIPYLDNAVRRDQEWPRWEPRRRIRQIGTQIVGIVGFGRIARHAARLFLGLGCTLIVYSRRRPEDADAWAEALGASDRVTFTSDLDALFEKATLASLYVSLNAGTRHLVGRRQLDLLGPKGTLVNTARGDVINEADLSAALRDGRVGAAALDVLSDEPPPADLHLFTAPNVIITPHCATGGTDVQEEKLDFALTNIIAFHGGRAVQSRIA